MYSGDRGMLLTKKKYVFAGYMYTKLEHNPEGSRLHGPTQFQPPHPLSSIVILGR